MSDPWVKPNPLLVASALVYGTAGLGAIFAPAELARALGAPTSPAAEWLAALAGAALFGLAMLDWMQRHSLLGGVLGRGVLVANLSFLLPAFFASLRAWRHGGGAPLAGAAIVLGILAAAFGLRLFRQPSPAD